MPHNDLKVVITPLEQTVSIALIGEASFDFQTAESHIRDVLELKPTSVVVDASKMTYISSIGMCFLINLRRAIRTAGGTVKLAKLQPLVKQAMERAHVIHLFDVTA
ncbi:MAG TPA: STAS domain-containing protein [Phycisphaerae bacterium]